MKFILTEHDIELLTAVREHSHSLGYGLSKRTSNNLSATYKALARMMRWGFVKHGTEKSLPKGIMMDAERATRTYVITEEGEDAISFYRTAVRSAMYFDQENR